MVKLEDVGGQWQKVDFFGLICDGDGGTCTRGGKGSVGWGYLAGGCCLLLGRTYFGTEGGVLWTYLGREAQHKTIKRRIGEKKVSKSPKRREGGTMQGGGAGGAILNTRRVLM